MVTLNFTLTPEAAAKIHDVLVCLGKFSDTVSIEARRERFTFTALNSSKSAYSAIALDGKTFFSAYECIPDSGRDGRFTCSMYTKALLSVFKGRLDDPRARDGSIDRCECSILDNPSTTTCRFIVRMFSLAGVIKTYKLTYEAVEVMHALFDRDSARNRWSIPTASLKWIEFFGAKTENLDICYSEEGKMVFKSYTEKVANGKDVLKHPLATAIAVNIGDFGNFEVQEKMHVIINVKDFKAIVLHAQTLSADLKAYYSQPTRPLQFQYTSNGMSCEYTLMTAGDYNAARIPTPAPAQSIQAPSTRAQSAASERSEQREMLPPKQPASFSAGSKPKRTYGSAKQPAFSRNSTIDTDADAEADSLFVPQREEEEDNRWDPVDYQNEQETLGWDASAEHDAAIYPTFRDSGSVSRMDTDDSNAGIAPTQPISQIKGLW